MPVSIFQRSLPIIGLPYFHLIESGHYPTIRPLAIRECSLDYFMSVCCSDLTSQRPSRFTKVSVMRARAVRPLLDV